MFVRGDSGVRWVAGALRRRPVGGPLLVLVGALLAASLVSGSALGRPGSGESFSGASPSRGGGSGGGGGDGWGVLFALLFHLCLRYPKVGSPLLLLVVAGLVVSSVLRHRMQPWSTSHVDVTAAPAAFAAQRRELEALRASDPELSLVLFEDFVYMLYAAVQRARGFGTGWLSAYLAPSLAASLTQPELSDVEGIVIGAMRYVRVARGQLIEVELELEANFVEVAKSGARQRWYVVDRLLLTRSPSARSRPFARAHKLDCPSCGAPLEALRGDECSYCRQNVGLGRFDWMVSQLSNRSRAPRGPLLTSEVPEVGTERPTVVDAEAQQRLGELSVRDPAFSWQAFSARVAHVFAELQAAWSAREALRIRPFVSDNLFQSLHYWLDLYAQQKCRNVTEGATITRLVLSRVTSDKHYDSVTVRLFASSTDFVLSDGGEVLRGHRSRVRAYSEYWTFIRGSARKGPSRGDASCPQCGAPLKVSMTGNCEYCRVKVTAGEFDWVLSRIEQDEAYTG